MSIELDLFASSRAPLLSTDREARKFALKAAHKFSARPTQYNLQALQDAIAVFEDAEVGEEEQSRFDGTVSRLEREEANAVAGSSDEGSSVGEGAEEEREE